MTARGRNKVITVERAQTMANARGEDAVTWAPIARCFARVRQVSGRELRRAMQSVAENQWEISIAYRHDLQLTTHDRIVYGTRTLDILSVRDVDEQHREIEIVAKEHET